MIEEIVVSEELSTYIESLNYEFNSMQSIIVYMIANGFDVKSESFKEYQKNFCVCKTKYDLAKNEMGKQFDIKGKWNLDFETRILSYEKV